jgi:hypothetical protein
MDNDIKEIKGEIIGRILQEIETAMWEYQFKNPNDMLCFDETALRAATKIFADILMEFNFKYRIANKDSLDEIEIGAQELGHQIRFLIRNTTGIDSTTWYKKENK